MNQDIIKKELYDNILEGDFELTEELSKKAIIGGIDVLQTIDDTLIPAIKIAGERFAKEEYFLPDLMRCANALKKALKILEAEIKKSGLERKTKGKIVIGTVKGDIHEIGKSIVSALLSVNGFDVIDIGVDIDSDTFINKIQEEKADILAMSALLPITIPYQGKVIADLQARNLRHLVKIMIGGAPVTQEHCDKIGADGYADNAIDAAKLAEELMQKK